MPFDPRLPDTPRERAAVFRSLPPDMQEDVIYTSITRSPAPHTGVAMKKMSEYLCLPEKELAHIEPSIVKAAEAELHLRIAATRCTSPAPTRHLRP